MFELVIVMGKCHTLMQSSYEAHCCKISSTGAFRMVILLYMLEIQVCGLLSPLCMLRKKQEGWRHGSLCDQRLAVSEMNEND